MTTLYLPRLIESVEQAEALPIGTVATAVRDTDTRVAVKHAPQGWWHARDRFQHGPSTILGFEALVPIEAEEEVVEKRRLCQKDPDVLHRYVTGWQPYTAKEEGR